MQYHVALCMHSPGVQPLTSDDKILHGQRIATATVVFFRRMESLGVPPAPPAPAAPSAPPLFRPGEFEGILAAPAISLQLPWQSLLSHISTALALLGDS